MAKIPWDVIIVGQGLAGTTLGLHLRSAGQKVLMLDRGSALSASRIAAGLMTPITGQRLTLSWRVEEFLPYARAFYRGIEQQTGRSFFHERTALRLFSNAAERAVWQKRLGDMQFCAHLEEEPLKEFLPKGIADANGGGFAMKAAQLDVAAFLEAANALLTIEPVTLHWAKDVSFGENAVSVAGHSARYVISCEGYAAAQNPYFGFVPFNAAKGDILTLRFDTSLAAHSLHKGIWLAPSADPQVFRLGASYDWAHVDEVPDPDARAVLEAKLKTFLDVPYQLVDHSAAVRPIIRESKALIGFHPVHRRLGFFNGLGSKGSLHGPWFAKEFSACLVDGSPVPAEMDVQQYADGKAAV